MDENFEGRVAVVTGAGRGLGREYARQLARVGARVVVCDIKDAESGENPAQVLVDELRRMGSEAIASEASVTDFAAIQSLVDEVLGLWGRVDILINNAGCLRDRTFSNLTMDDFRTVMDVHFMGAVHCTKAVWDVMRNQAYGRIVMTTSSSGLYGNFGQSNYGAAKMALVGLMQTLSLEGHRHGIRVNCIAPTAGTRMLEGVLPEDAIACLKPELVSPAVLALVSENAPTRMIMCAGAGAIEAANITLTQGIYLEGAELTPQAILDRVEHVADRIGEKVPATGFDQARLELSKAGHAHAF